MDFYGNHRLDKLFIVSLFNLQVQWTQIACTNWINSVKFDSLKIQATCCLELSHTSLFGHLVDYIYIFLIGCLEEEKISIHLY